MPNKLTLPELQRGLVSLRSTLFFLRTMIILMFVLGVSVQASAGVVSNNTFKIEKQTIDAHLDSTKVYKIVEQMPEIVGGLKEIYKNIKYPKEAIDQNIEGRVFIRFVVDENGGVEKPEILKDIGAGCGDAAVDAIEKVKFTPGRQDGKAVKVWYALPINFKIQR